MEVSKGILLYTVYRRGPEHYYRNFNIPKKGGGVRNIAAPSGGLRVLQQKLARILHEIDIKPECSHAFHKDRSILTNAAPHKKSRYVFNVDLVGFFDAIHFGRVAGVFATAFSFPMPLANLLAHMCCYNGRLPQGAPSSPAISNLVAYNLDKSLVRLAKRYKITYSRYADDITFSSKFKAFPASIGAFSTPDFRSGPSEAGPVLLGAVAEAGFEINHRKTRLQFRSFSQSVTGLIVNEFPNVKRERIKKLRKMLFLWKKFGLDTAALYWIGKTGSQKDFLQALYGELSFIRSVRGSNDTIVKSFCAEIAKLTTQCPGWVKVGAQEFKVKDIFLSHASEDKDTIAKPIYDACSALGLSIFYDSSDIEWGDSIVEKINKGLGEAKIFLPIITPNFIIKKWPIQELNSAFSRFMKEKNRILPIISNVTVEDKFPLLSDILYRTWNDDPDQIALALQLRLASI